MSIRRCLILGWMAAGLQVVASAQTQTAPAQNAPPTSGDGTVARTPPAAPLTGIAGIQGETEPTESSDGPVQIPALLGGAGISTAFISELKRSNYLRGGLNVGAVYDSNLLLLPSGGDSSTGVSIFPNLAIEQSTSRMRYVLGYAGGFTFNTNLPTQNTTSQNLNFDSQFRLSPHVNLRIAENFSYTTGLFDAGTGTVSGGGGPNAGLITPQATQLSNTTTVEANYHFALNDLVGASGSFNTLQFSNPPDGAQLQLTDSQTASASAFWLHRIIRQDWAGVTYHFDRITFDPNGETRVQSVFVVNTLNLSDRFTLTGFIGPQYSDNQGLAPGVPAPSQTTEWSVAGGIEGGWKDQRTSVSAGYSRIITDGGGVLGAVRLQNVHGIFRREVVARWVAGAMVSYGTNDALTVPSAGTASSINLTSVGVSLEHNVAKSLGFRMGYTHDFQKQFGLPAPSPTLDASRNRFFVTLSYQWAKPLGM